MIGHLRRALGLAPKRMATPNAQHSPVQKCEPLSVAAPGAKREGTHDPDREPTVWYRSTFLLGVAGSLMLWLAFPPVAWGWLGWLAPVPWLIAIRRQSPGKRPYLALYVAGLTFWLAALQWLRLPHPATCIGWFALSAYLACYLPVFAWLTRVGIYPVRLPLWIAAPVVWTGLELLRAHLLTGFLLAALGHTQVHWKTVLQISDTFGGYGVSFLMMLVAAAITTTIPQSWCERTRPMTSPTETSQVARLVPLGIAGVVMIVTIWYGHWRIDQLAKMQAAAGAKKSPYIALIQGNSLATWKYDPQRQQQIMAEYIGLSEQAVRVAEQQEKGQSLDLVIWPETMFRTSLVSADDGVTLPAEISVKIEEIQTYAPRELAALTNHLQTPVLVGIDRRHIVASLGNQEAAFPNFNAYNSVVLADKNGNLLGIYDKVHRVMFGEYVPLVGIIPFFDRIAAITGGIEAGLGPVAITIDGIRYAPTICYETVIPHVIRHHVAELTAAGQKPDVLVNLTNDAWYWGSSALDMHLNCGIFRAIECRTPLAIAANGGISASIDSCGQVLAQSPRQATDILLTKVPLDPRSTLYTTMGDWFSGICLVGCIGLALLGCGNSLLRFR
jgi:apolipoprotein N-acyltransferase